MHFSRVKISLLSSTLFALCSAAPAQQNDMATVEIFAAGSLRGVVSDLADASASLFHVVVKPTFGGSGALRERVEKGEHPHLLLSADLDSPRKLEAAGRTVIPVVAFARNRLCVVSRREAGITPSNLIDALLKPETRVRTSTPVVDPSGDYAWSLFDRIDRTRPGAGARLKEKARAVMNVSATPADPKQSAAAALFASRRIDVSITYCSASVGLERELPELVSLPVPAALDPHPVYGIAVLSDKPAAQKLVLFLLSEKGQAIIAHNGLLPLLEPAAGSQP
jgi:ABC-type molybdate transport system substrate-binding protein